MNLQTMPPQSDDPIAMLSGLWALHLKLESKCSILVDNERCYHVACESVTRRLGWRIMRSEYLLTAESFSNYLMQYIESHWESLRRCNVRLFETGLTGTNSGIFSVAAPDLIQNHRGAIAQALKTMYDIDASLEIEEAFYVDIYNLGWRTVASADYENELDRAIVFGKQYHDALNAAWSRNKWRKTSDGALKVVHMLNEFTRFGKPTNAISKFLIEKRDDHVNKNVLQVFVGTVDDGSWNSYFIPYLSICMETPMKDYHPHIAWRRLMEKRYTS